MLQTGKEQILVFYSETKKSKNQRCFKVTAAWWNVIKVSEDWQAEYELRNLNNRKNILNLETIENLLFSFQNRTKVETEIELKAL